MPSILFVGDSITVGIVGYPAKTDGTSFRGPFLAKRPTLVGTGPFIDPKGLRHGGVGGATTNTFLSGSAQFVVTPGGSAPSWMDTFKPDFVHIMLGTNDLISHPSSPPIQDIIDNLESLCALAKAQSYRKANRPTHIFVSTISEIGPEWFSISAHALNAKIKTKTWKSGGVVIAQTIDTCQYLNDTFWKEGFAALSVDGTHPNARGYKLMADGLSADFPSTSGNESSAISTGAKVVAAMGVAYLAFKAAERFR